MNPAGMRLARAVVASGGVFVSLVLAPIDSRAQAWLPEKGSMSFSLDYSDVLYKKHFTDTGDEIDVGHTSTEIIGLSATYSPSDRWQLHASLPYVKSRYIGSAPHPTEVDDGNWHGTFSDLLLAAHYQVTESPIGFAPFVAVVIPVKDYETLGHAAPGRELDEYWLGFYAARSLNEWIPRTYVQTRFSYAFVEKVAGVSHDRTNASLEIGHFLNESWSGQLFVARQWTDGGVNIPLPATSRLFPFHDQLASEELLNAGAGIAWAVNDRLSVSGFYVQSLEGENGHKMEHRFSLGMTYGVGHGH
jgi:hypothetical protein